MSALDTIQQLGQMGQSASTVLDMDMGELIGKPNKMSLSAIKSRATGYAKPNRFMVVFAAPKTIATIYPSTKVEKIVDMVREATLPAIRMGTFEHRSKGPLQKLPNDVIFNDVNISFYIDKDMAVRQFFQDWLTTTTTNNFMSFNYLEEYATNIQIIQLDEQGKGTYAVELIDAYPISMTDVQLSMEAENTMMFQNVSFSYHTWREVEPTSLERYTLGGMLGADTGKLSQGNSLIKKVASMANRL